MGTKKVVFILSSSNNQNALKRMEEFRKHDIIVEGYGFKRHESSNICVEGVHINEIGSYDNSVSYKSRIPIIRRGILAVIRIYKHSDVLFYLFGLDVAGIFRLQSSKPYIYEEEDLMYTYIGNLVLRNLFTRLDRHIVNKSVRTVFTSEGFAKYHFGDNWPEKICIIPNKLKKDVIGYPGLEKPTDISHLDFAFVGSFRFQSVYNFARVVLSNFPNHTFHFFGAASEKENEELFNTLKKYDNCIFHGRFKNPIDLPSVYSQIDLLLSTYDVQYINVRFAEPNKLYEAIFYDTPIIVSLNSFLGDKVEKLGVGYAIDALDDDGIISFVNGLTLDSINEKKRAIKAIDKLYAIDDNSVFIESIKAVLL